MRGLAFALTLPLGATAQREKAIFDAVRRRNIAPISWSEIITTDKQGNSATFKVSDDAVRIGDAKDSFRATVSHRTAQLIADELGAVLPTAKLSDEIWAAARVRLSPRPQKKWVDDDTMSHTRRMLEASEMVDSAIAGRHGLTADVGKDWVNTNRLTTRPPATAGQSANYGWHGLGLPLEAATFAGTQLYQTVGLRHPIDYVDYSQVVRLVQRKVRLCDAPGGPVCRDIDIQKIASDPQLSGLLSHEGPVLMRHPGVVANCPVVGACPGLGTRIRNPRLLNSEAASPPELIPCPDIDCDILPPPQPAPSLLPSELEIARAVVPAVFSFLAGAAVGYLAVRTFLPRP